jgi:hypothetical protein
MEPCYHDETYLEFVCEFRVSLGCLGAYSIVEGEELLAGSYPSNLFLELEEVVKAWRCCYIFYFFFLFFSSFSFYFFIFIFIFIF